MHTTITVKTSYYYYETIEETNAKSDYLLKKIKNGILPVADCCLRSSTARSRLKSKPKVVGICDIEDCLLIWSRCRERTLQMKT